MSSNEIPSSSSVDAINHLREKLRRFCIMERESKRNLASDSVRLDLREIHSICTELENLNEKDVAGICARIKRRKRATREDMFRLNHAFLQSNHNIVVFAKIPGAINVIVKELTGHDSEQQIRACETLCNLSLGDDVVCEKIATFAGSYIVTYFYSTENRLKRTSLWVIMNIAVSDSSGNKGLAILLSQEIISKLVSFYCNEKDADLLKDVAICLDLILSKISTIRTEDLNALRQIIPSKSCDSVIIHNHLKIIFHLISTRIDDHEQSTLFPFDDNELKYLISICFDILKNLLSIKSIENYQKALYSIRIISNLIAKYSSASTSSVYNTPRSTLKEFVFRSSFEFSRILSKIFEWNNHYLNKETLWLIKNLSLLNEQENDERQQLEVEEQCSSINDLIVKNLKIKRTNILFMYK